MSESPPQTGVDLPVVSVWALLVAFERRLASELSELGVTVAGFRLIGEVMRTPGGIRQGELARRLGVRPPTVSASVARLEERGLVHRVPDPEDTRARRVCLSPDASLLPGFDVLVRMDDLVFDGLSDSERRQTLALLERLRDNLEPPA